MKRVLVAAITAGAIAGPVAAVPLTGYTSLLIFGDSLSDPGNLFEATDGALPPNPPYPDGRFTNGDVWAQSLTASFEAAGRSQKNLAFGGAKAELEPGGVFDLPEQAVLATQIPDFRLGTRPMAISWAGSNDGITALNEGLDVASTAVAAANSVADTSLFLNSVMGIEDFAFFNLPDLGITPRYVLDPVLSAAGTLYTDTFNATLAGRASDMRAGGLDVIDVDVNTPFKAAVADPQSIGLISSLLPCVLIPTVTPPCSPEEAELLMFFDPVHPNSVVHGIIGEIAAAQITPAPVPLPAPVLMLLAGVAALFGVRRIA